MLTRTTLKWLLSLTTWDTEPFVRLTRLQTFLFQVIMMTLFAALGYVAGQKGIDGAAAILGFGFAGGAVIFGMDYIFYSAKKQFENKD